MGRRRIVRTPSEEREYKLRRKEMRRARIRARTDEQRAIERAKHAELQRRRRQDAALREREAAERRKRREDPEVRQLEAEAQRARREDAALRRREAEARRKRRQDPALRQMEAEARRARREDEAVRAREAEARRERRQDPVTRQLEAAKHRARREDPVVRERERETRRQRRLRQQAVQTGGRFNDNPFGYACDVCSSLGFKADLSPVSSTHVPLLAPKFPYEDVSSFMLCSTCHRMLRKGTIPTRRTDCLHPVDPSELLEVDVVSAMMKTCRIPCTALPNNSVVNRMLKKTRKLLMCQTTMM
ncbi:uncharacterized protein LOC119401425 isoform X2 [Rhipicephalus sanguineus]|uniref:uncharacterized protein LOC119401425 isoform X2 n=1 Tax=Rhipicephalus sanguineus TaxID=34632 RepID=UPI00189426D0|nr:uncharacterized protein LOC119401425 isoform X2 [Rhipicephalus sanguineus]